MHKTHGIEPCARKFAELLHTTACARPGLRELYNVLAVLRHKRHIRATVMCTAARNKTGWVTFLHATLAAWYGRDIYDGGVVTGHDLIEWSAARNDGAGGAVYKDMDCVRARVRAPASMPVLAIDDRPEAIVGGVVLAVPAYCAPRLRVEQLVRTRCFDERVVDSFAAWLRTRAAPPPMQAPEDRALFDVALRLAHMCVPDVPCGAVPAAAETTEHTCF
jgi:hypothetical protein